MACFVFLLDKKYFPLIQGKMYCFTLKRSRNAYSKLEEGTVYHTAFYDKNNIKNY